MKSLISYFGCGKVYAKSKSNTVFDFRVTKFSDLIEKVIPFFDKYSIVGVKYHDYEDFKRVAELMKNGAHLTSEGLDLIRLIKKGINKRRKFEPSSI